MASDTPKQTNFAKARIDNSAPVTWNGTPEVPSNAASEHTPNATAAVRQAGRQNATARWSACPAPPWREPPSPDVASAEDNTAERLENAALNPASHSPNWQVDRTERSSAEGAREPVVRQLAQARVSALVARTAVTDLEHPTPSATVPGASPRAMLLATSATTCCTRVRNAAGSQCDCATVEGGGVERTSISAVNPKLWRAQRCASLVSPTVLLWASRWTIAANTVLPYLRHIAWTAYHTPTTTVTSKTPPTPPHPHLPPPTHTQFHHHTYVKHVWSIGGPLCELVVECVQRSLHGWHGPTAAGGEGQVRGAANHFTRLDAQWRKSGGYQGTLHGGQRRRPGHPRNGQRALQAPIRWSSATGTHRTHARGKTSTQAHHRADKFSIVMQHGQQDENSAGLHRWFLGKAQGRNCLDSSCTHLRRTIVDNHVRIHDNKSSAYNRGISPRSSHLQARARGSPNQLHQAGEQASDRTTTQRQPVQPFQPFCGHTTTNRTLGRETSELRTCGEGATAPVSLNNWSPTTRSRPDDVICSVALLSGCSASATPAIHKAAKTSKATWLVAHG